MKKSHKEKVAQVTHKATCLILEKVWILMNGISKGEFKPVKALELSFQTQHFMSATF